VTELRVDVTAATPAYEQIRSQLAALVAVGALVPGERLPASRDLARDQRAYRELEAAGVVLSRRRTGTVVADGVGPGPGTSAPDPGDLLADVRALVGRGRAEGLGDAELLLLVRGVLAETPGRAQGTAGSGQPASR
jgi:GntR family transcriptional regulator